ncbi:hypothetical protein yc1106_02527 [Curvularia clavata]|uniref:Cytochrome P450 n=1 Tax=Curvularia clavata TaxID=95742 RepID=A0A9Q8Z6L2_CURCL|nr:hypothetical protein yc1106_02527 [Curvularia clavata]
MSPFQNAKEPHVENEQTESQHTLIPRKNGVHPRTRPTEIPTLCYRHRALWVLALYVPILVVPWALTCVLAYHPLDLPSYIQTDFTESNVSTQRCIVNALAVLNSLVSVVTIPLVSALVAQAAVVYTQRRRKNQTISISQTFALADGGWSNPSVLYEAWPPWKIRTTGNGAKARQSGSGSGFLWLAALFVFICSIQQPIREGFVTTGQILVMTTKDDPAASQIFSLRRGRYMPLGFDPEPDDMSTIPEGAVVQRLENSLASLSSSEVPTHLWPDLQNMAPFELKEVPQMKQLGPWAQPASGFFVAALPNGTTTGILRHRAMRLNSTVRCNEIEQSSFPSTCAGENPFTSNFSSSGRFGVRICVPGQRGKFPWQLSRSRQDTVEDIFVDANSTDTNQAPVSYTQHCTVKTTRGYFELGSDRNGGIYGPLLEQWVEPDPLAQKAKFNDYLSDFWRDGNKLEVDEQGQVVSSYEGRWRRPSEVDKLTDIPGWPLPGYIEADWPVGPAFNKSNMTMAGPLMTSAVTLFGENSLFAAANESNNSTASLVLEQTCRLNRLPFSAFRNYRDYAAACESNMSDDEKLLQIMKKFIDVLFSDWVFTERYLSASVFHANEAMLVQTSQKTSGCTARTLFSSPGTYIPKPEVSLTGIIIISALLLLELIGLAYLAWYIYQVPTWTAMLDALAIARITNSLDKGVIPAIGSMTDADMQRLKETDALVGVVETAAEEYSDASPVGEDKLVELGLAKLISEGLAKYEGPFMLARPHAKKIVLPLSHAGWVKTNKDLDHRELARQDFYAGYPGFEGQTTLHSQGDMLLDVIKTKLGQNNSIMPVVNASLADALTIHWGTENTWHSIDWQKDTTAIMARAASSIFVGPDLAHDQEWLTIIQAYVGAYFTSVSELEGYPSWSRPIMQRFLPNANACRKYRARVCAITKKEISRRAEETQKAKLTGKPAPHYNDALAWTHESTNVEAGDIQLALSMAAMLTTSELFRQVLIDIAAHPDIIEPLKSEISQQLSEHGITVAATQGMVLLDSVMKESQRRSAALVSLERVALKDTKLPDGKILPRGSHIMVDATNLFDPALYPQDFDGYRFLRKRQEGDKSSQFVQSSQDFNVFGGGRHICPGRFFVSNELKLAMAHVLLKYNIRLAEGYTSKPMVVGAYQVVDPMARFEVQRVGSGEPSLLV